MVAFGVTREYREVSRFKPACNPVDCDGSASGGTLAESVLDELHADALNARDVRPFAEVRNKIVNFEPEMHKSCHNPILPEKFDHTIGALSGVSIPSPVEARPRP